MFWWPKTLAKAHKFMCERARVVDDGIDEALSHICVNVVPVEVCDKRCYQGRYSLRVVFRRR